MQEFDFIIVGAGSAGCVLANRLSANPDLTVCLVEAGATDNHPYIHIPAATGAAIGTASLNWSFQTTPQANLGERIIPHHRGKGLGGSSAINGMVYFRGHPLDFDDWAAGGASGWSYAEVLPYFKRSEDNLTYRDSPYHGTGGEMAVSHVRKPNPLNRIFEQAMSSQGYNFCEDFNGPDPEGYGPRQMTIRNGRRVSMATAFIKPVLDRPNLGVLTNNRVNRILLSENRATGVEIEEQGKVRPIYARREVIVCAGAIQSPQLLMLSGIGDGEHLQSMGIEVNQHLPAVGSHFQDHLSAPVMMETDNPDSYGLSWKSAPRCLWNILEYLLFRQGALASNLFESAAFLKTRDGLDRPDLQFVYQPARKMLKGAPFPVGHGYVLNPVNLYPQSKGWIRLQGPDAGLAPAIDPNLLDDPTDAIPIVRGIEIARLIFADRAYAPYQAVEVGPGPEIQGETALMDYIRQVAYTVNHPACSCRMGAAGNAVVDAALRVHGVRALRIADASVFPKMVGGNINAAVVMVAEKASDLILQKPQLAPENPGQT